MGSIKITQEFHTGELLRKNSRTGGGGVYKDYARVSYRGVVTKEFKNRGGGVYKDCARVQTLGVVTEEFKNRGI
jgi:hypothetical protein